MGEFVVITGESGSGKSTLLNVISGLDSYEEGEMYINGEETSHYTEVDYENYRRKYIGNIFQNFNLVNSYTVFQNVELVLLLNGYRKKEVRKKVLDIIKTVGLTKYKNTKVSKLSGGQKQRVAIARALAKDTPIIVADEPTGNLDVGSAKSIMKLLKDISNNKLVVIVTHNYEQVEEYATRKISMNDGKIIEDKKLQTYDEVEPEVVKYKDLRPLNKLLIGFRNAFNIKTKFLLLFFVYFFLTFLVFSVYSSLSKQSYDESLEGYNPYFQETSPERIILKKKNNEAFTDEEINKLSSLNGIKKIEKNDLLLDLNGSCYDDEIYLNGQIKSLKEIDKVDLGTVPQNDNEVVVFMSKYSYYVSMYEDKLIGRTMTLQNDMTGTSISTVKLAGIIYDDKEEYLSQPKIYISDNLLDEVKLGLSKSYSNIAITLNDKKYIQSDYKLYYELAPNKNVHDGEAYVFEEMNMYCSNYNCLNKKMNIEVENIYFKDNKDFTIKRTFNKDNFKRYTSLTDWESNSNKIFISESDFQNLFYKGDYQISVFLNSTKEGTDVISNIESLGYETYYMKDNLVNEATELLGILRIIRSIVFIIATVALFFISYFIIKIILKSRNVYYSTIRILGATKKIARQLLNIELFIDINIAYIVFLLVTLFARSGIIEWNYITDMVTYFTLRDYILVYIVLTIMSLLISNRYAHKLFKSSAMHTYREEV